MQEELKILFISDNDFSAKKLIRDLIIKYKKDSEDLKLIIYTLNRTKFDNYIRYCCFENDIEYREFSNTNDIKSQYSVLPDKFYEGFDTRQRIAYHYKSLDIAVDTCDYVLFLAYKKSNISVIKYIKYCYDRCKSKLKDFKIVVLVQ